VELAMEVRMIWQCVDCGHQVVNTRRPAACRFCGSDVEFFVSGAREAGVGNRSAGHPGIWSVNENPSAQAKPPQAK
jgi:hypothetical protein